MYLCLISHYLNLDRVEALPIYSILKCTGEAEQDALDLGPFHFALIPALNH